MLAPRAAEGRARPEVLARARSRPGSPRCWAGRCRSPPVSSAPRSPSRRRRCEPARCSCSRTCGSSRVRPRTIPTSRPRSTALGDCYVDDAFGAVHRSHASIVGPPARLPCAAGRLLAREVDVLGGLLDAPGAAVRHDPRRRQGERQARRDRRVARTVRHAARRRRDGVHVPRRAGLRRRRLARRARDGRPCRELLETGRIARAHRRRRRAGDDRRRGGAPRVGVAASPTGGRVSTSGPRPRAASPTRSTRAATVLWNGPMGVFELAPFAAGTRTVARSRRRLRGVHGDRRRRQRVGRSSLRVRGSHRPCQHRRWREPRAPRAGRPARVCARCARE